MLVLLPPSETKISQLNAADTRYAELLKNCSGELTKQLQVRGLQTVRKNVRQALKQLSTKPDLAAHKTLKLSAGEKADAAFAANRKLASADTIPAVLRYTGVLYDALEVRQLPANALQWLAEHVAIHSALYGLVSAGEDIALYRLSAGSSLPALEHSLKSTWRELYQKLDWSKFKFIVDLRSNDYAALAPTPTDTELVMKLEIVQRAQNGDLTRLNHFNKAAKGDLVSRLAQTEAEISSIAQFVAWATEQGLEVVHDQNTNSVTLITALGAPQA